jgi:hypothetical protein
MNLATALSIRDEIGVFVTYDDRLSVAVQPIAAARFSTALIPPQVD